uniref:Uncharacterized protein n=1 Tax=Rhizochromulina marina TaxID=1034831 RepID=A0A7S2RUC6_9STRA
MDETFLLITGSQTVIFVAEEVLPQVEPLVLTWSSAGESVVVHSSSAEEPEAMEEIKVHEFRAAMLGVVPQGSRIGTTLHRGASDVTEIERWPLVASFAVESAGTPDPSEALGFLSMRYQVKDLAPHVLELVRDVDGPALYRCAERVQSTFREHWSQTMRQVVQNPVSAQSRRVVRARDCVEQLSFFHEFVSVDAPSAHHDQPWALVGPSTQALERGENLAELSAADGEHAAPLHVVVEGTDPAGYARACRTFFFALGSATDTQAAQTLSAAYCQLLSAFHGAMCRVVQGGAAEDLDEEQILETLRKLLTSQVGNNLELVVDIRDALGESLSSNQPALPRHGALCYVRACLHSIRAQDGQDLGAVAVGDTFALCRSAVASGHTDFLRSLGEYRRLAPGECGLLTGDACCPYFLACTFCQGEEEDQFRQIYKAVHNNTVLCTEYGMGRADPAGDGDVTFMCSASPVPWAAIRGQLKMHERGFVLWETGIPPVVAQFSRNVRAVRLHDLTEHTKLLVVSLFTPPGEQGSDDLDDLFGLRHSFPPHQEARLGLVLRSGSSLARAVESKLSAWRRLLRQTSVSDMVSVDEDATAVPAGLAAVVDAHAANASVLHFSASFTRAAGELLLRGGPRHDQPLRSREAAVPVALILGVPGSNVLSAAHVAMELAPDDVTVVGVNLSVQRDADFRFLASEVDAAARQCTSDQHRVLVAVTTPCSARAICTAILQVPSVHLATVSTCIGRDAIAGTLGQTDDRLGRSSVLGQLAHGWVAAVVVWDAEGSSSGLHRKIRQCCGRAEVIQCAGEYMSLDGVRDVLGLGTSLFAAMSGHRDMIVCRGWQDLSLPPLQDVYTSALAVSRITVPLQGAVDLEVLQTCLRALFPRAKLRMKRALPVAIWVPSAPAVLQRQAPASMERVWTLAAAKTAYERRVACAKQDAVRMAAQLVKEQVQVCSIAGSFLVGDDEGALVEGSQRVCMIWNDRRKRPTGIAADEFSIDLFVAGSCLQEQVTQLQDLIKLCCLQAASPLPPLKLESLTHAQRQEILELCRDEPLPADWMFDGSNYINFSGRRQTTRPDEAETLQRWIEAENAKLREWNTRLYT